MDFFQAFKRRELEPAGTVSPDIFEHLIKTYGSEYSRILEYCHDDRELSARVTTGSPVIRAEVLHGVRHEMAQTLADVVFRRTELGTAGYPGDACLRSCAGIMAAELRWDQEQTWREIEEVKKAFEERGEKRWQVCAAARSNGV
jgi:glycerol-3-phosphate dehydrogenase